MITDIVNRGEINKIITRIERIEEKLIKIEKSMDNIAQRIVAIEDKIIILGGKRLL